MEDSGGTKIISGRKNRGVRYYDTLGHEIPWHDTDAIHDIAEGRKIVHYHEEKVEKEEEKKAIRKIR